MPSSSAAATASSSADSAPRASPSAAQTAARHTACSTTCTGWPSSGRHRTSSLRRSCGRSLGQLDIDPHRRQLPGWQRAPGEEGGCGRRVRQRQQESRLDRHSEHHRATRRTAHRLPGSGADPAPVGLPRSLPRDARRADAAAPRSSGLDCVGCGRRTPRAPPRPQRGRGAPATPGRGRGRPTTTPRAARCRSSRPRPTPHEPPVRRVAAHLPRRAPAHGGPAR